MSGSQGQLTPEQINNALAQINGPQSGWTPGGFDNRIEDNRQTGIFGKLQAAGQRPAMQNVRQGLELQQQFGGGQNHMPPPPVLDPYLAQTMSGLNNVMTQSREKKMALLKAITGGG